MAKSNLFTIIPDETNYLLHVRKHIEHYAILLFLGQAIFFSAIGLATGTLEEEELGVILGLVDIVPRDRVMLSGNIIGIVRCHGVCHLPKYCCLSYACFNLSFVSSYVSNILELSLNTELSTKLHRSTQECLVREMHNEMCHRNKEAWRKDHL